jgi:phosphatidylinositol glycan class T
MRAALQWRDVADAPGHSAAADDATSTATGIMNTLSTTTAAGAAGGEAAAMPHRRCDVWLPREPSCSENVLPMLQQLPCRQAAGVASLLDPLQLFAADFHALRVHVRAEPPPSTSSDAAADTVTLHVRYTVHFTLPVVAADALRQRPVNACAVAASSAVSTVPLATTPPSTSAEAAGVAAHHVTVTQSASGTHLLAGVVHTVVGNSHPSQSAQALLLLHFPATVRPRLHTLAASVVCDTAGSEVPSAATDAGAAVCQRGDDEGAVVCEGVPHSPHDDARAAVCSYDGETVPLLHCSAVRGVHVSQADGDGSCSVAEASHTPSSSSLFSSPSSSAQTPLVVAVRLSVPPRATVAVAVRVVRPLRHIDAHPPDPNRGVDLPPAVLTLFADAEHTHEIAVLHALPLVVRCRRSLCSCGGAARRRTLASPRRVCSSCLSRRFVSRQHGLSLVVTSCALLYLCRLQLDVALPDFSMPFNVVMLTSTVLAFVCGSTINVLSRKPRPRP